MRVCVICKTRYQKGSGVTFHKSSSKSIHPVTVNYISPMEVSNKIIPPHLNAEVYRTDTTGTSTLSYLDYIRLHPDGRVLIGCSELTGRYWNGGVNIFNNVPSGDNTIKEAKKNISLTSGTADGCFIENSNKVLLCEDSGALSMWTTKDDVWKQWNEELSVAEHDDAVLAVECINPGKEYITSSADGNVKVWDINELLCIRNYDAAHTMAVNTVSVRTKSQKNFATGSLDQYISLWDENFYKPVCDVIKNDCGIRCLRWIDEHRLLFGDEAGWISLVDVRKPGVSVKLVEFPAAVHQIVIQSGSRRVAVCCDNRTVNVYEIPEDTNIRNIYKDGSMHKGFVRGLAWDLHDNNILYTVGWDGDLIKHCISK